MDLIDVCLRVTCIFPSLAAFKIFLFVFVSGHFTPRSLDIWVFFVLILLEVRGASWAHSLMSFITFIKFLVIIFLDIVSAPLSLLSFWDSQRIYVKPFHHILSLILFSEFYTFFFRLDIFFYFQTAILFRCAKPTVKPILWCIFQFQNFSLFCS